MFWFTGIAEQATGPVGSHVQDFRGGGGGRRIVRVPEQWLAWLGDKKIVWWLGVPIGRLREVHDVLRCRQRVERTAELTHCNNTARGGVVPARSVLLSYG